MSTSYNIIIDEYIIKMISYGEFRKVYVKRYYTANKINFSSYKNKYFWFILVVYNKIV